jgi:hypothetical protein
MMSALCNHLLERPTLYQDEMAEYLMAEFGGHVSKYAVRRVLVSIGWSRKQTRRVAQERNADLRDFHLRRLSEFSSYHLDYVDESGCDKRVGIRRTGWSPRGTGMQEHTLISVHTYPLRVHDCLPLYSVAQGIRRWLSSTIPFMLHEQSGLVILSLPIFLFVYCVLLWHIRTNTAIVVLWGGLRQIVRLEFSPERVKWI